MLRVIQVIQNFLNSLATPVPEVKDICLSLELRCKGDNPNEFIREVLELLGKHDESIVQRDESVILSGAELLPGLVLGEYWTELSEKTKDAIWKYLNLILLSGAKHLRSLERNHREKKTSQTGSRGEDGDGEIPIAERLKDPEIRERMMETIRKTIETLPETTQEGNAEAEAAIQSLMGDLQSTNLGTLIQEIVSDLSGDITPETLGLPEGSTLESMGTDDLMGLLGNPTVAMKLMALVGKIGDKINTRLNRGDISKEDLIRESQELLSKSGGLLGKLNPQAAAMLRSMGIQPEQALQAMNSRKFKRAMNKKSGGKKKH
jgi:hypothetical protein